uniref:T-complex-associated-testis-expressed 1 n=1 Tax=Gadus morhua TaxID=8049 RepID=A0A8C5FF52_GADMO
STLASLFAILVCSTRVFAPFISSGTMSKSIDPPVEQINAFGDHGPLRRIIAEDPEWSLALVPPLSILCLQNIVTNFEGMLFKELLPAHKEYVLGRLPPSLPLHVTANLISDPGYWRRCCVQRWNPCDVSQYGHSWKRMFFEKHLENLLELFIPDVTPPQSILELVPLCRDYVLRLDVSQLLPPIKEPGNPGRESDVGPSMDHFDFGLLLDQLSRLEELRLVYRVRGCGMNFEWNLFEFTLRDCEALARALKSCHTLKVLRLCQSKVEDERCRILALHLLDHPSLLELDLSHNLIGDRGARAIAKLLSRSRLEGLDLYDNEVAGPGGRAIAHALSRSATLRSLNLRLNRLGDEGGRAVGQALLTNRTLRRLHLGANEMGEASAAVLAQVLVQNDTLTSINLSCNSLGADGGKILEDAMSHNNAVTEFDVRLTEVGEGSEAFIGQRVRSNQGRVREHPA